MAKTPEEHKAEFEAGLDRFSRLIPFEADELTVILKGHLLIEEQLRAITRSLVANPQHFDNARLTFSNSLHLARAIAGHFSESVCWSAAERLNAVRNRLAHQAEPVTNEELFAPFFDICEAESRWSSAHFLPRGTPKLRQYISHVWVTLDTLRAVVQVCVETAPTPLTSRDGSCK